MKTLSSYRHAEEKVGNIFSLLPNRLFRTSFIINVIEVNVRSLGHNLYWSQASVGQVVRYSACLQQGLQVVCFFRKSALESVLSMD